MDFFHFKTIQVRYAKISLHTMVRKLIFNYALEYRGDMFLARIIV